MTTKTIDAILIDDDPLIHNMWEYVAVKYNKRLYMFKTPEEFCLACNNLPLETPIYIDSNLANGIKGEIVSEKMYLRGFKNIYLVTGEPANKFKNIYWLKGIANKSPPWV